MRACVRKQGLLSACYGQLGQGLGAIAGGFIMQHYGATPMFLAAAAVTTALLLARVATTLASAGRQSLAAEKSCY